MARNPDASPKDRLVETALRLFHQEGFHATGIDRILAEAKVSKKSLYTCFASKDALILEVLRVRDQRFRSWLIGQVESRAPQGAARYLAVIDVLAEWVESGDFYGCLFINATAEYGAQGNPVRVAAAEHKAKILDWLRKLASEAGAQDPELVANMLALIKEGIIVSKQVSPQSDPVTTARAMIMRMIGAPAEAKASI